MQGVRSKERQKRGRSEAFRSISVRVDSDVGDADTIQVHANQNPDF